MFFVYFVGKICWMNLQQPMDPKPPTEFQQHAAGRQPGFFAQFLDFALHNKKWWLTPILLLLLLASVLIILGGSGVAPFIYTIF